jgi:hypothetical protein
LSSQKTVGVEIEAPETQRRVARRVNERKKYGRRIPKEVLDDALVLIAAGFSPTGAAKQLGFGPSAIKRKCESDPDYAARFAEANEQSIELLEDEARRRAMKHSDLLLIFLLKARRPDLYRENVKHEHEGQVDLRLQVAAEEFQRRFTDRYERQRAIEAAGLRDN